ncbi:MAG: lipid-binding SYLF domain-containing protein [Pirellulales bacterium]|jgi:lipid-binding SYLF domain-containing protein|nr:lipid-binding SYLF domain-containing protein [Pirellulales bacterium]
MRCLQTPCRVGVLGAVLISGLMVTRPVHAQVQIDPAVQELQTVNASRNTLDQFCGLQIESIPQGMLAQAEGIAIFPNMIKGGFIFAGNYGKGVLMVRNADRSWSPPAMCAMGGGSLGFQVGVQAADIVLVFATPQSLQNLLQGNKVTLGADASVALGPIGRQANAGTDARLGAEIYSYARSRGLFLGVSVSGADISIDNDANAKLYGRFGVTPSDVFNNRGLAIRPEVVQLVVDLNTRSAVPVQPAAVTAVPGQLVPQPTAVPQPASVVPQQVPVTVPPAVPQAVPPATPQPAEPTIPQSADPPLVPVKPAG